MLSPARVHRPRWALDDQLAELSQRSAPILVVGLGNPLLGDDGVGWRVAGQAGQALVEARLPVEVDCLAVGGLSLMERLVGYRQVILIDAIQTGKVPPGHVHCFPLADLADQAAGHLGSAHDTTLQTALKAGRALGVPLPAEEAITVIAIEAERVYDFTEELTPAVAAAVPLAVAAVVGRVYESMRQLIQEEQNGIP